MFSYLLPLISEAILVFNLFPRAITDDRFQYCRCVGGYFTSEQGDFLLMACNNETLSNSEI